MQSSTAVQRYSGTDLQALDVEQYLLAQLALVVHHVAYHLHQGRQRKV